MFGCFTVEALTFVAMLCLPQVDLGYGFKVDIPQPDAAVSSSCGETLLTRVHAEDPRLNNRHMKTFPIKPADM